MSFACEGSRFQTALVTVVKIRAVCAVGGRSLVPWGGDSRLNGTHTVVSRAASSARVYLALVPWVVSAHTRHGTCPDTFCVKNVSHSVCCVSAAIDARATVTHAHLCPPRHGLEQPALLRALLHLVRVRVRKVRVRVRVRLGLANPNPNPNPNQHRASERLHRTRLAEGGACTVKGGRRGWLGQESGPASVLGALSCPEPSGAP